LGGVNDIGTGYSTRTVYSNLKALLTDVVNSNAIPILLTIPPIGKRLFDEHHLKLQKELNLSITQLSQEIESCILVDLFHLICDESKSVLRSEVVDLDGLHFTEVGYQTMARAVFENVNWEEIHQKIKSKEE
jgi:lysophospholipase L1-like esterase